MYYKELSSKIVGSLVARWSGTSQARQLIIHRSIVLILTFFIYSCYHMSRRPLAIVKSVLYKNCSLHQSTTFDEDYTTISTTIVSQVNLTNITTTTTISPSFEEDCGWAPFDGKNGKSLLSVLDSCFLFMYAFCMFFAGYVAERSNFRYFLSIALTICGAILILFGLGYYLQIHALWYYVLLQLLGGVAQTSGWPTVVAVVGEWFGTTKKGLIMGLWNWHTSVGNILGAAISGAFVEGPWGMSFIAPGIICIVVAFVTFLFLIPKPDCVGLEVDFSDTTEQVNDIATHDREANGSISKISGIQNNSSKESLKPSTGVQQQVKRGEEAISLWKALLIPGVIEFSLCLFFAKLVSYTFLYWLPLMLEENASFSSTQSAYASIMFDIGGCLGSLVSGFLADRTGAPGLTCIVFLILAIPSLFLFNAFSAGSMASNQVLQFVSGAFINGPYALITTAVSANLACKVPSQSAMATVSAIIDGTGSIGAAIGPLCAGLISNYGWQNVLYMAMGSDVIATLLLLRVGWQEIKQFKCCNRR